MAPLVEFRGFASSGKDPAGHPPTAATPVTLAIGSEQIEFESVPTSPFPAQRGREKERHSNY